MTQRQKRILGNAVLAVIVAVALWRVPGIAHDGEHASRADAFLGLPVDSLSWLENTRVAAEGRGVVYLYAESCPYCAIDHEKVAAAAQWHRAAGEVPFTAAHLGTTSLGAEYWTTHGKGAPEIVVVPMDGLAGTIGVPVVLVVQDAVIRRAWLGLLRWNERDLRHAIDCALGDRLACTRAFVGNLARGFAGRFHGLVR